MSTARLYWMLKVTQKGTQLLAYSCSIPRDSHCRKKPRTQACYAMDAIQAQVFMDANGIEFKDLEYAERHGYYMYSSKALKNVVL